MDLPKIKNEDLPKELKEILGDADAEFEAIVDPTDIIIPPTGTLAVFGSDVTEEADPVN